MERVLRNNLRCEILMKREIFVLEKVLLESPKGKERKYTNHTKSYCMMSTITLDLLSIREIVSSVEIKGRFSSVGTPTRN